MTDKEIKKHLKDFINEIFYSDIRSRADAIDLKNRIDIFCKEHSVTPEQRQVLATSGACETLAMMVTTTEDWVLD